MAWPKKDGRLRLGDQIVQIDGEDVKTKPEAQEIFVQSQGVIKLLVARPPHYDETGIHNSSSNENEEQYVFDEIDEDLLLDQHRHTMETSFIQNLQISPIAKLNLDKTSNRSSMTAESSCCDSGIHAAPLNTASTSTQSSTKSEKDLQDDIKNSIILQHNNNNNNNDFNSGDIVTSKDRK